MAAIDGVNVRRPVFRILLRRAFAGEIEGLVVGNAGGLADMFGFKPLQVGFRGRGSNRDEAVLAYGVNGSVAVDTMREVHSRIHTKA